MTSIIATALRPDIVRRSLIVALIVGTVLNVINQGDLLLAGETPVLWKLALTYLVPIASRPTAPSPPCVRRIFNFQPPFGPFITRSDIQFFLSESGVLLNELEAGFGLFAHQAFNQIS